MPRNDMTLSNKISLLDLIKSQPYKASHRQLALLTGVPRTTIGRLLKDENKLREEWDLHGRNTTTKRKREGKDPDVEEALDQWFSMAIARGLNVSGPLLKLKSEEFAKKLGHHDFKATDGWLARWKARRQIKYKNIHGEKGRADKLTAEEFKNMKVPTILHNFSADNIYNADETGLYYRATPDGSLCYKHDALLDYKNSMDHITILCCTNMLGTDKRKLLVIGKNGNPRCFKGIRIDGLPVEYHANKNACMTSDIFRKWLTAWDIKLQYEERKILLLVDNCAAHPHLDNLKNITLEFLPSNTTSTNVQPMENGVIKNLKRLYRGKLVNYILESIEDNLLTTSSTATDISAKINLLQAIQFIADSWRNIKESTIQNCFAVCGFQENSVNLKTEDDTEDDVFQQFNIVNYDEFLTIDNNLSCYDETAEDDDAIVEGIKIKHEKLDEDDDSDDENLPAPVTFQEARNCISVLQRFFMQVGSDGSPISELNTCDDFVEILFHQKKKNFTS